MPLVNFVRSYLHVLSGFGLVSQGATPQEAVELFRKSPGRVVAAYGDASRWDFTDRAREFCCGLRGCVHESSSPSSRIFRDISRVIDECWPQGRPPRTIDDLKPVFDSLVEVFLQSGLGAMTGGNGDC